MRGWAVRHWGLVALVLAGRVLRAVLDLTSPDVGAQEVDSVLTALAGTRMSTLRDLARAHGHWLTPDVPAAEGATLGGVLAAGRRRRARRS
mgnify:CR=1 FL=1